MSKSLTEYYSVSHDPTGFITGSVFVDNWFFVYLNALLGVLCLAFWVYSDVELLEYVGFGYLYLAMVIAFALLFY